MGGRGEVWSTEIKLTAHFIGGGGGCELDYIFPMGVSPGAQPSPGDILTE